MLRAKRLAPLGLATKVRKQMVKMATLQVFCFKNLLLFRNEYINVLCLNNVYEWRWESTRYANGGLPAISYRQFVKLFTPNIRHTGVKNTWETQWKSVATRKHFNLWWIFFLFFNTSIHVADNTTQSPLCGRRKLVAIATPYSREHADLLWHTKARNRLNKQPSHSAGTSNKTEFTEHKNYIDTGISSSFTLLCLLQIIDDM